jgi:lipopolysaccharide/colanic/teichoic acid biosynthesis glycosyltransferase
LLYRPGLTSPATVTFRHEEALLGSESDVDGHYRAVLLPAKLATDLDYMERATMRRDLRVLARTAKVLVRRAPGGGGEPGPAA